MPYAMASSAVNAPLYLSEPRSLSSDQPLSCLVVDGVDSDASGVPQWQVYCDSAEVKVGLPAEVVPVGMPRVHLLTLRSDGDKMGTPANLVSFMPSKDCM